MTKTFHVQPDGSVSVAKEELLRESRHQEIEAKIDAKIRAKTEDPNASPDELRRLFFSKVFICVEKLRECGEDPFRAEERQQLLLEARCFLAAAERQTTRVLADNRDRSNYDGPKFQFAISKIIEMMEDATRMALGKGGDQLTERIMNRFHELCKEKEPDIRRHLAEIDSQGETIPSDAKGSGNS